MRLRRFSSKPRGEWMDHSGAVAMRQDTVPGLVGIESSQEIAQLRPKL